MTEKLTEKIAKTEAEWRQQLTPEQYHVTREAGTELFSKVMAHHLSISLRRFLNSLHRAIPKADRMDLLYVLDLTQRATVLGPRWDVSGLVPEESSDHPLSEGAEDRVVRTMTAAALSFSAET